MTAISVFIFSKMFFIHLVAEKKMYESYNTCCAFFEFKFVLIIHGGFFFNRSFLVLPALSYKMCSHKFANDNSMFMWLDSHADIDNCSAIQMECKFTSREQSKNLTLSGGQWWL